jgi:hypothetical protein
MDALKKVLRYDAPRFQEILGVGFRKRGRPPVHPTLSLRQGLTRLPTGWHIAPGRPASVSFRPCCAERFQV